MNRVHLLIADDERDTADLLGDILTAHFGESTVRIAYDGHSAMAAALEMRPDVAILDLEMPGLSGEDLARALRCAFPDAPPRLIALSGNVVRLTALRSGGLFDYLLSKPTDVGALLKLVSR